MSITKRVWIENDPDFQDVRREASASVGDVEREYPFRLPTRRYATAANGKRQRDKWWFFAIRKALSETTSPIVWINSGVHFQTREELESLRSLAESYLSRPGGLLGLTLPIPREEYLASRFERLVRGKKTTVEAMREKAKLAGRDCPDCGYPMKIRTARKGANAGSRFLGCSLYPSCKGTRAVD